MSQISLASYTLRVLESGSSSKLNLDQYEKGKDLLDAIAAYLDRTKTTLLHNTDSKKLVQVKELTQDKRLLTGLIETGEYGYSSDLLNIDNMAVSYTRQVNDAEMLPFYFLIYLPPKSDEGIIFLQRFRNLGIRKMLWDGFQKKFAEENPGFRIEVNHLAPSKILEPFLAAKGAIKEMRFIS